MTDRLRPLWDFDDLDATEARFLAAREPGAAYWRGPLLNNLGWHLHDAGAYEEALEVFEQALRAREEHPESVKAIAHARDAVATARRALGRR